MLWYSVAITCVCAILIVYAITVINVTKPKKVAGILRIDNSDPDGPYLFLELSSDPKFIMKEKYITLKVNTDSYISHK